MALTLNNLGAACGTTRNLVACAGTTATSSMSQFMSGGVGFDSSSIIYYRNGTYTTIPIVGQMYEWYVNWNTGYGSRFYRIMDDGRGTANYSISAYSNTNYVGVNNAYWDGWPNNRYRVNGQVNFGSGGTFTLQLTNSYEWNVGVVFAPELSGGGGGGGGQGGGE